MNKYKLLKQIIFRIIFSGSLSMLCTVSSYGMILDDENHLNRRVILQSPFHSDPEDENDADFFMTIDREDYYDDKENTEPFPPSKTGSLIKAIEFHRANNLPLSAYYTVELYNMLDKEDDDLQGKYKKRKIGTDLAFETADGLFEAFLPSSVQALASEFPEGPLAFLPLEIQEHILSFFDQSSFHHMNQKAFEDQLDIIQGEQWHDLCLAGLSFKQSCIQKMWPVKLLSFRNIMDMGVRELSICNLSYITELDLSDNQIQDEGIEALATASLYSLAKLNLSHNYIQDNGVVILAFSNLTSLIWLSLANNNISSSGAAALILSPNLTSIEELHLQNNPVSVKTKERPGVAVFY